MYGVKIKYQYAGMSEPAEQWLTVLGGEVFWTEHERVAAAQAESTKSSWFAPIEAWVCPLPEITERIGRDE